jgi:hypothetical protein
MIPALSLLKMKSAKPFGFAMEQLTKRQQGLTGQA